MTLEIVPLLNPYGLKPGATLPARVFYLGKPRSGANMMLSDPDDPAAPPAFQMSGKDGRVEFPVAGRWRSRMSVGGRGRFAAFLPPASTRCFPV